MEHLCRSCIPNNKNEVITCKGTAIVWLLGNRLSGRIRKLFEVVRGGRAQSRLRKSNLHYRLLALSRQSGLRVTRSISTTAPIRQHSSEETLQRCETVGDTVLD